MTIGERWERWHSRPFRLRFWREFLIVGVFDLVYEWTSDFAGSSRTAAYHHALAQIRWERALGLFQERTIQAWFLHSRLFIQLADLFYATIHFALPVVALVWLFRSRPERYLRWRDALAWTTALALVCFTVFPLMPPRMLPSSYGIVDTMVKVGGLGSWDRALLDEAGNQFAAMPSLHVSWALWSCLALLPLVRRPWAKALLILDPIATVAVILATGNHFTLDIVGGVVVLGAGYGLALLTPRFLPRRLAVPALTAEETADLLLPRPVAQPVLAAGAVPAEGMGAPEPEPEPAGTA